MSTPNTYLAVFTSNKTSPRWRAWYAMSEEERPAKDEIGLAALKARDEKHKDAIVYQGGPLGPTKRTSPEGVADLPVRTGRGRRATRDARRRAPATASAR